MRPQPRIQDAQRDKQRPIVSPDDKAFDDAVTSGDWATAATSLAKLAMPATKLPPLTIDQLRLLQDAVTRARSVLGGVGIVLLVAIAAELQGKGVPATKVEDAVDVSRRHLGNLRHVPDQGAASLVVSECGVGVGVLLEDHELSRFLRLEPGVPKGSGFTACGFSQGRGYSTSR